MSHLLGGEHFTPGIAIVTGKRRRGKVYAETFVSLVQGADFLPTKFLLSISLVLSAHYTHIT